MDKIDIAKDQKVIRWALAAKEEVELAIEYALGNYVGPDLEVKLDELANEYRLSFKLEVYYSKKEIEF